MALNWVRADALNRDQGNFGSVKRCLFCQVSLFFAQDWRALPPLQFYSITVQSEVAQHADHLSGAESVFCGHAFYLTDTSH